MENEDELRRIYDETKTIAVVGASGDPTKPGHEIPRYLRGQGYRIIPVSPKGGELLGETVRTSLDEIDEPVDAVDVFRPPPEAMAIAEGAAKIGAKVLWFQEGTDAEEAVEYARNAGLTVIHGRCMGATHGQLGLGPGPWQGI
ncbi:MAG: CoA-binding protein [Actinomycetota bacterium]